MECARTYLVGVDSLKSTLRILQPQCVRNYGVKQHQILTSWVTQL
jgi:hypothetical protein